MAEDLQLKALTPQGCFSSVGTLGDQGKATYQSKGYCQTICVRLKLPVTALFNGTNCYCGDSLPSRSSKVSDDECSSPCVGYPQEMCTLDFIPTLFGHGVVLTVLGIGGGPNSFTFYLDGLSNKIANAVDISSSTIPISSQTTSSPTENGTPSEVIAASTVYVTQPGTTSATIIYKTEESQASGPNKVAIIAGVVVGIVGLCAVVGGLFLWLRSRKRRAVEEDHRRNTAMKNLVNGQEKGSTTVSLADSRLEPSVMFQRRQSDGSIADNHDYSRRILKVRRITDQLSL